jgi:hypothetical protein
MKKEYIRTTHNFDNETREWIGRDGRGQDKHKEWNDLDVIDSIPRSKWSFGVHALSRDHWMGIEWIIDETIKMFKGHASDYTKEFEEFIKNTPNYRDIIKKDIEEELVYLVKIDMVRVKEISNNVKEAFESFFKK